MSASGLDAEARFATLASLRWREFERFMTRGVPARAMAHDLPARARVAFLSDQHLFDFANDVGDEGSEPAFIFLARDELGDVVDLVAWSPASARIGAWYGRASMLGLESLYGVRLANDGALQVHESPLEWLGADRAGVVIVNPDSAAPLLRDSGSLFTPTEAFAVRLRKIVAARPVRILVPKASALIARAA